ncbi:MAG: adenosylmethionine--8-amino-7-oxononanoate transaminase [Acidobacteriota bacterium]|nr:adenosylmethionine--8-amino-7-oxononanoate transaminase [Blastocatellia bacterium]MDW8413626.1 adenosylmethionine--8-amino-7-oxononanoate transaminase [Acidobacteriota bacterium]
MKSDILTRDLKYVWHPYTQAKTATLPVPIVRGEGVYLYTEDGRRLLDGISSWWVNIHGHSHPRLNDALYRQASILEHVVFAGFTHRPAVELAERLIELLPKGITRVFYSDNGSTAVEVALKMAYQYWKNRGQTRRTFLAMEYAYHGDTFGAMASSARSVFTAAFEELLFHCERVSPPYCYRCPLGLERSSCKIDCLELLENKLRETAGECAAVIVEPMVQGAGGMIIWPAEYLASVRRLCDKYDVLLIADEVFTGFGRTGKMFACEHASISPDIICLSKALTGGYLPLAVTATTEAVYEAFYSDDRRRTFFHGHSYTANPLSCAVALESLAIFQDEAVLERVGQLETRFKKNFSSLIDLPRVGEVRIIGALAVVELVEDKASKKAAGYLDNIGTKITAAALERGLLLRPLGNVLYFLPPYVITEQEVDYVAEQIYEILRSL